MYAHAMGKYREGGSGRGRGDKGKRRREGWKREQK